MVFDGKNLFLSETVDDESYYPRSKTFYLITPDKKKVYSIVQQYNFQPTQKSNICCLRVKY